MAATPIEFANHLYGKSGAEELQNFRLWQQTGGTGSGYEGSFWYNSTAGDKRIHFYDGSADIKVPRLDRAETVTGQYQFAPGSVQAPFTLSANAQGQLVTGLNSAQLSGFAADQSANASTVAVRDASGRMKATDPSVSDDVVNLGYMESYVEGVRDPKDACRVATTAALPANTRLGNTLTATANGTLPAQDGVTLSVNDRILVKNESAGANNGIYYVSSVGSAGTPWVFVRTTDADASSEVTNGLQTWITEGTVHGSSGWLLTTADPITLNTTALVFIQTNGTTQITAGGGLTKTGNTLDIATASSSRIVVNADNLDLATTAVAAAAYGAAGSVATFTVDAYGRLTTAATVSIAIAATQVTSGLLALARGGTNADLSGVATGGLVYKAASALAGTAALTGILIGNGASAPTALTSLTVALGGTGSTTASGARTNLSVLSKEESHLNDSGRFSRGGLFFDGTTNHRLNGTSTVSLGTNDFSIYVVFRLTDATPASDLVLWTCTSTINTTTRHARLNYSTSGAFQLIIGKGDSSGVDHTYTLTPDSALLDNTTYAALVTADRDGNATLYVHSITDRDLNGTGVSTSMSDSSAVDISGGATAWASGFGVNGEILDIVIFNRVLSATDALVLAQRGQGASYIDQWGTYTAQLTTDFSAGTDGWSTDSGRTVTGNVDTIAGEDNWLKTEVTTGTVPCYAYRITGGGALNIGKRYKVSAKIHVPSGSPITYFQLMHTGSSTPPTSTFTVFAATPGTTQTVVGEVMASTTSGILIRTCNANGTAASHVVGTLFYIKDVVITQVGAVLALDLHNADPTVSLTVRDMSSNANHGTLTSSAVATQTQRTKQLNVDSIFVSGYTSNSVIYASTDSAVLGLTPNSTGTTKFLTQVSSGAPAWTDLFGGANTWSGANIFSGTIEVPAPSTGDHAVNKNYVDSAVTASLRPLASCRVATNVALPANTLSAGVLTATANGSINSAGVDGVTTLVLNDRVLVKDEGTAAKNGIYYVSAVGDGANPWTLTRSLDADAAAEITRGAYSYVTSGTVNIGSSWVTSTTVTTIDTDTVTWVQFFQQAAYVAGSGISIVGQTLAVDSAFSPTWTGAHTFQNTAGLVLAPWSTSTGNTTELRFKELAAGGSHYVGFKAPDSISASLIWTLPSADGAANSYLKTNGAGTLSFAAVSSGEISNSHFVTSVTGTTARISIGGSSLSPSVDIDTSWVGQTSITTLGTISSGTWNAGVIGVTYGGTGFSSYTAGDFIYASGVSSLAKLGIESANKFIRSTGTAPAWSGYSLPATVAVNQLLYGTGASTVDVLATAASRVLITDGTGNISWGTTLPTGLSVAGDASAKITKLKWFDVGNGSSSDIALSHGFGTTDVVVLMKEVSSGKQVYTGSTITDANTVTMNFIVAPSSNAYRACVIAAL